MNRIFAYSRVLVVVFLAVLCFDGAAYAQSLQTWNGRFSDGISFFNFTMVGTDPSTTNKTTNISAYLIPLKLTFPDGTVFDAQPVVQTVLASPVLCTQNGNTQCSLDFVQDETDLGTTQYVDAFQRGNFWTSVQLNSKYHVLLTPVLLPEQSVTVPSGSGWIITNSNGTKVGSVTLMWLLTYIQGTLLPSLSQSGQIHPNGVAIPLTYDVCAGSNIYCMEYGLHSYTSIKQLLQTYAWSSYVDQNAKSQAPEDVDILTHEIGEWVDDPYTNNAVRCQVRNPPALLEVGDPLVNHDYLYTVNGFNYHLQDLVWMPYFGQTPATSLGGWFSFQGEALSVCENGP